MFNKQKLIGNFYMVTVMSLSVSIIHIGMTGNVESFFAEWGKAYLMALPLAVFFTTFIGTVTKAVSSIGTRFKRVPAE